MKNLDFGSKMDPYVVIEYGGKIYQTPSVKEGGQTPVWNFVIPEDLKFKAAPTVGESLFKIKCMDDDFGKDEEIGNATFKLSQVVGFKLEGLSNFVVQIKDDKG